ncbi:MAG TPA: hypothetical protein VGC37_18510 [Friedmanniella sp.]
MTSERQSGETRPEVRRLAAWAPIPPEEDEFWQQDVIDGFAADIAAVAPPLTASERDALLALLEGPGDDTVYGVLWGVLHLVETAPEDGYEFRLQTTGRPWFERLLTRRINADRRGESAT